MKETEKVRVISILQKVDEVTTESKQPMLLSELIHSMRPMPDPTTYAMVGVATKAGYLAKGENSYGKKSVALTLRGYKMIGSSAEKPEVVETEAPSEAVVPKRATIGYEEAYRVLSQLFLTAGELKADAKKAILKSLDKLVH